MIVPDNKKPLINEKLDILLVLPVKVVLIRKASICYNKRVKKSLCKKVCNFIQSLLSVGIRSYFTQCNVFEKMRQMYLSIVE